MKKTLFSIFLFLSACVLVSFYPSHIVASGVKVITQPDGTTYLGTEVDEDAIATTSSRYYREGNYMNLLGKSVGIEVPEGFARDLAQVINAVLSFVMVISALLVLFYLIWGAFDWITSGGDKGKIQGARQKIIAAVVGLLVVSASYAILILAVRFLGFESLNDVFDSVRTLDTGSSFVNEPIITSTSSATTK